MVLHLRLRVGLLLLLLNLFLFHYPCLFALIYYMSLPLSPKALLIPGYLYSLYFPLRAASMLFHLLIPPSLLMFLFLHGIPFQLLLMFLLMYYQNFPMVLLLILPAHRSLS